tara:strand:+ start:888 stop:1154 length:267 start_codon:yes stop_codon:yes gene_type:complete
MCEHDINDRKPFEDISLFMLSQCRFGWMKLDTDEVSITYRIFINEEEHEKAIMEDIENRRVQAVLQKKLDQFENCTCEEKDVRNCICM